MRRVRALVVALVAVSRLAAAGEGPPPLAWELEGHTTPRVVWANMKRDVVVRLRNAGTSSWTTEAGDHLAYHWFAPDGRMVVRDGLRTRYPREVLPGETVEVVARVEAPAVAGRYLLEWEPLRELVRWYGPPVGGARYRVPVLVTWRCAWAGTGLALLALAVAVAGRVAARRRAELAWWWRAVVPVVGLWATTGLLVTTFSELVGRQLWTGVGWLVASGAALVVAPVLLVPVRARSWTAAGMAVFLALVVAGDLLYLRWFGNIVPLEALAGARQVGRVEGSIRSLFQATDVWLLPIVVASVLLALLAPAMAGRPRPPRRSRWLFSAVLGGGLALSALPAARAVARALEDPAIANQRFSEQMLVGQWGILNLHLLDVARHVKGVFAVETLPPHRLEEIRELFARRAAAAPGGGPGFGVAHTYNLVLVQVESLQQWVVGARVGGQEITPFLNTVPARGLYFSSVFDQSAEGRSSDGEFVTLNSLLPLPRGAVAFLRSGNRFFALPSVLKEQGYATLSAHAFERGFWNRASLHRRYGFDRSLFQRELGRGEVIGWGLADGPFLARVVRHLETLPQPFFAFCITLGLHHPFDQFPARHKVMDVGELTDTPLGNYVHAMHYVDEQLRRFVAALDEAGLLRRTVVAIYGDHESGLAIDANLLRVLGTEWQPSLPLRLRRVPFLVLLPEGGVTGEVAEIAGHVDIAPTLLHLLGLPRPRSVLGSAILPGRDAVAAIPGGSAAGRGRLYAAGGACFAWEDGSSRPLAECEALRDEARKLLEASATVLDHDLVPLLAEGAR